MVARRGASVSIEIRSLAGRGSVGVVNRLLLLPFDRAWRLVGDVVKHCADALNGE